MIKKYSAKTQVSHYAAFFVLYFGALYYFLYASNDLSPFQVNFHFFSNIVGSLSKRYLSEVAPYALLFLILFYSRQKWLRIFCLIAFYLLFLVNVGIMVYYFNLKSNFQLYVLEGFTWPVFFSYFTPGLIIASILLLAFGLYFGIFLYRNRGELKKLSKRRKWMAAGLLPLVLMQSYVTHSQYDLHETVTTGDRITKKTVRAVQLEDSGLEILAKELLFYLIPHKIEAQPLTEDELAMIADINLDENKTQTFEHPPKKIMLVVAESLDSSFLSYYNQNLNTTPTLDSLLAKYPHIDDFYPSGPFTIHGLNAVLCGHTNLKYGTRYPNHECVPELLSKAGFKTEMLRGASKYYIGENVVFSKFGFEKITAKEDLDKIYPAFKTTHPSHYKTWGYTDNFLFEEALNRLRGADSDEKLFLTLLGVDTHIPGGRCFDPSGIDAREDLVLFSVSCFDNYVKNFMDKLEADGLLTDDLLVIFTSDQLYPAFTSIPGSDYRVSFKFRPGRIPFLMLSKQNIALEANHGSQIDIAASILDLVNLDIPDYYMGKSLLSNEITVPMGQDRADGFAIVDGTFNAFDTYKPGPPTNVPNPDEPIGFKVDLQSRSAEEIVKQIELAENARDHETNGNQMLYKWYYNHYYVHELN